MLESVEWSKVLAYGMDHERVEAASLSIGKVARRAGIGVETTRLYEREGLLAPPARKASGYRLYSEQVLSRIQFIRRAKDLGFSLREIKELLQLRKKSNRLLRVTAATVWNTYLCDVHRRSPHNDPG